MHIAISKFAIAGPELIRERERNIIILALSLNHQIIFQRAGDYNWVLAVAARAVERPDLGLVVVEYVDFDVVARLAVGFGCFGEIPLRQVQAAGPRCVGGTGPARLLRRHKVGICQSACLCRFWRASLCRSRRRSCRQSAGRRFGRCLVSRHRLAMRRRQG